MADLEYMIRSRALMYSASPYKKSTQFSRAIICLHSSWKLRSVQLPLKSSLCCAQRENHFSASEPCGLFLTLNFACWWGEQHTQFGVFPLGEKLSTHAPNTDGLANRPTGALSYDHLPQFNRTVRLRFVALFWFCWCFAVEANFAPSGRVTPNWSLRGRLLGPLSWYANLVVCGQGFSSSFCFSKLSAKARTKNWAFHFVQRKLRARVRLVCLCSGEQPVCACVCLFILGVNIVGGGGSVYGIEVVAVARILGRQQQLQQYRVLLS